MKWKLGMFMLGLLFLGSTQAMASNDCAPGQYLKIFGQVQTSTANITASGVAVRLAIVSSGSSAGVVGLYDTTTVPGTTAANLKLELGSAANTAVTLPYSGFFEAPVQFVNGVTAVVTNSAAISIYGCQV